MFLAVLSKRLITADEIVAAGSGKYGTANNSYYLNKGSWFITEDTICYIVSISCVYYVCLIPFVYLCLY